ncbi:6-hydroxymethylpterin diphosphokinase MptE-like protein [Aliamphritea spongicola]|nr:6-hydroxymethylpterin diphosphokinase MptE-like protein [Aliamphritea spongicola]
MKLLIALKIIYRNRIFNLSKYYIYYHYENNAMKQFINNFQRQMKKVTYGYGFYDDERVGLSHTIENTHRGYPVSRVSLLQRKDTVDVPVIIIGNGPSLDESINFIKANRERAIIISCGSSFGTLKRLGIKPHIHIEQERPQATYDWLKSSTDEEIRKGVYFLA